MRGKDINTGKLADLLWMVERHAIDRAGPPVVAAAALPGAPGATAPHISYSRRPITLDTKECNDLGSNFQLKPV